MASHYTNVMISFSHHQKGHICFVEVDPAKMVRCKNVRNVRFLALRGNGEGQGWVSGPMLRSRFRRSSFRAPLAAIAAPGGTVEGVGGHTQFRNCWPYRDSALTRLCAALLWCVLSRRASINLWVEQRGPGGRYEVGGSRRGTIKPAHTLNEQHC